MVCMKACRCAINVHGTYLRVIKRVDENTLLPLYAFTSLGVKWGERGDSVSVVESEKRNSPQIIATQ